MMEFLSGALPTVPIWLVWPIAVGVALYWYLTMTHDYWKKAGIPHETAVPILGSTFNMFTKLLHEVEMKSYRTKGRIFGTYEGRTPILNVGEPDVLRDIFVKDFQFFTGRRTFEIGVPMADNMVSLLQGEAWKRVRTVITPAFSTGKIKRMISIFQDSSKTLMTNFKAYADERKPTDVKRLFGTFAMDVIACSAFATKLDSYSNPDNPFVAHAKVAFTTPIPWRFALFIICPAITRFFGINVFTQSSIDFFEKVTLKIIEERKRTKQRRNDFLQLLLDAADRESEKEVEDTKENADIKEMGHEEENEQVFKSYQSSKSLSNIELVANSVIFFLAGYETTATTLSYITYELAMNPDVQDKLVTEIDEAINEKGELNYEAICEMKYMDMVISETLRKYPVSVRTERLAEEDYEIKCDDMKISVPKGRIVGVPIYAIHHDPEFYPDPEKFDPDRFSHEQKSKRHPYTYLPFGAGPRNCIGMRFALMEIKVCLANVLREFRFSTCSKTQVPVEFVRNAIGILQSKPVILTVESRSDDRKS